MDKTNKKKAEYLIEEEKQLEFEQHQQLELELGQHEQQQYGRMQIFTEYDLVKSRDSVKSKLRNVLK